MRLKVVFIEDEIALCENFIDIFSTPEIEIRSFSDPFLALPEICKNPPDVVFVDYRMPGIKGDALAAQMPASISKYLLTGELDPQPTSHFDDIILKPFNPATIRALLDQHLEKKKAGS